MKISIGKAAKELGVTKETLRRPGKIRKNHFRAHTKRPSSLRFNKTPTYSFQKDFVSKKNDCLRSCIKS
jgi:hypothetical protein